MKKFLIFAEKFLLVMIVVMVSDADVSISVPS